jgi:hypothetical protein
MKPTTQLHLMLRIIMSGGIPPLPHMPYMAYTGTTFPFPLQHVTLQQINSNLPFRHVYGNVYLWALFSHKRLHEN